MDLNGVEALERPRGEAAAAARAGRLAAGEAWLAGGTWLFSEPQPGLRRLVDLEAAGWTPLTIDADGLEIAATCTIAELDALETPADWAAAPLIGRCCRAFLASFKIWNVATVGGNLCLALPAGPMISLTAALDGTCRILGRDGATREVAALDFVRDAGANALARGELLRAIRIPADRLRRRTAFRRISLSPMGRTGALAIGALTPGGGLDLTVTGGVRRPVRIAFPTLPAPERAAAALDAAIPAGLWFDDLHGAPAWRRAVTLDFAAEIAAELGEPAP
ncbi:CO or xanthine dehydrogenase, FAD-binding subunit [Albimonas donghaensis]|uniref:CO or xanthine dehydrogenase, FAD-binding subunit n=1 Tax=Albimonas donghaensis TaxID=356660 RepID=A0A1H3DJC7_9RHOB|nr:FAD binding domain-containing protein [Albimonas donghaensis]SDX66515.1 CO or xanthine dehydrogenase, FAD-binding subunit [Albimonas donghaensis]